MFMLSVLTFCTAELYSNMALVVTLQEKDMAVHKFCHDIGRKLYLFTCTIHVCLHNAVGVISFLYDNRCETVYVLQLLNYFCLES